MAETGNLSIPELINIVTNRIVEYSGSHSTPPIVSIISSFYNAHHYFEETYRSIMNQTMQNFEWIIVDDCSTDNEAIKLFDSLETRSSKIKTFRHLENKGLSAGRNTAITKAGGRYLFFIDCDDLIDPTYLEKCVLFLELYPDYSFVNSRSIGFQTQEYLWNKGFESSSEFIRENLVTVMLMYRKSDFDKLGGFDEELRYFEDWERWLRALAHGQKGWTISEYLHFYRRTDSGLLAVSQKEKSKQKKVTRQIQDRYSKHFNENHQTWTQLIDSSNSYHIENYRQKLSLENVIDYETTRETKILFLYPHLEVGGADRYNLDLVGLLKERGYQLTIATTLKAKNAWHKHFYKLTPDIFHLSNYADETKWLNIIRYLIESRKIDVIFISNSYFAYYLLPILRNEYPNVAFIDNVHIYDKGWRFDGYPRLSRQFNEFFDAQIVTSKHLADYNEDLEPSATGRFSVCTTNIEPDLWNFDPVKRRELRKHHNIPDKTILLIFPARLETQKRPGFFVKIIEKLAKNSLPVKALILGEGGLLNQTQNLIDELDLNDFFTIIPPVNPDLMKGYYSAADILLLPTEYEGISLSLFEAMAMQLPLVASDVGGQSELVIEGTGYLLKKDYGSADEVDAYYKVLFPLISDENLRKNIGQAARKRILDFFTLETMGDRIEEIMANAINKRKTHNKSNISSLLAEELLIASLECSRLERELFYLHSNLQQLHYEYSQNSDYGRIKAERDLLLHQKQSMEASKFWKIRQKWFKLKYKTGLSKYES